MRLPKISMCLNVVVSLGLVACAGFGPSAEPITGPDGTPHQLVSCGNIRGCYDMAAEVCRGKYKIVNTSNDVHSTGGSNGVPVSTSTSHRMLVKCD